MPSAARSALYPAYKKPPCGGYRKTERRQHARRTRQEMPPWRARFVLDGMKGFGLMPGTIPGIIGSSLQIVGGYVTAEVVGGDRAWVIQQAEALAHKLVPYERILAVVSRDPESGPTLSDPLRPGLEGVVELRTKAP